MQRRIDNPHRRGRPLLRRRGITAVLAMIFMGLIGMLALGFYSTITTSTKLAHNDQNGARALVAAESGLQFMRYHLAWVELPPNTPADQVLVELHKDLMARLQASANLGAGTVALLNDTISIPAESGSMIEIDPATRSGFAATITAAGGVVGSDGIVCTVTGYSGVGTTRGVKSVQLHFIRKEFNASVLNSAVATRGRFTMLKGAVSGVPGVSSDSIANVTSAAGTSPAVAMSGGAIGGKIGLAGGGSAAISGGSVSGTSNLTTIHQEHVKPAGPPGFPYVDTSIFAPFAVNTFTTTSSVVKNIRIPAGTNPRFTADVTIQGVMYIESPNTVEFRGNTRMEGFIVFEQAGDSTVNRIDGRGNFTYGNLPAGSQFDPLRNISGIAMLAPTASLTISGSVDSQVRGNMILGSFNNAGSADLRLDKGSIVTMDNTATSAVFNGKAVKFSETGLGNPPSAGVLYGSRFLPEDGTYAEGN